MKIKHVEEMVGITSKNIRFYEEQGLLTPKRAENGYREYHAEDIERLMQIKLLRKIGVSIEQINLLLQGKLSLAECMEKQTDLLEQQKKNLTNMQLISKAIVESDTAIQNLNAEEFLERVEKMEKEGTFFMDIKKEDVRRKKQAGAVIAGVVVVIFAVIMIAFMLWANTTEPIPIGFLLFFVGLMVILVIGIVAALIGRMKEIKGGEEDEAVKY